MEKWKIALPLVLILAGAFLLLGISEPVQEYGEMPIPKGYDGTVAKIHYTGIVCPIVTRTSGEVITLACHHNLLTDRGRELIELEMRGDASVVLDKIAIGNCSDGTQLPTDTNMQSEWLACGLGNATGTLKDEGTGNWSITYEWTSACDGAIMNATGIYNTTMPGNLFAEANYTSVTLNTGEKLNITYFIWVLQ